MTSFYDNLSEEMSMLIGNPQQEETTNFIINGEELNNEAKLIYEKNRIILYFTHINKENMDFIKYNAFRKIIDKLSSNVDGMTTDYEILKKIMVHIELELGMNILFSSTLVEILDSGLENIICYENENDLTYEKLYEYYRNKKNRMLR